MRRMPQSLKDYSGIVGWADDGLIDYVGHEGGFLLKVSGIDPQFFDEEDWASISETWRSFLRLSRDEEIQIVLSRRGRFEELAEKKFQELSLIRNAFTRRLYMEHLNDLLDQFEDDEGPLFSTQIFLSYRHRFKKGSTREEKYSFLRGKREQLTGSLANNGLSGCGLDSRGTLALMTASASGSSELPDSFALEWPLVSISRGSLEIEDDVFRALSLTTLPEKETTMGMLWRMAQLPMRFDLSVRFRGADPKPVRSRLERKKQMLFAMKNKNQSGDSSTEAQYQEVDEVLRRLSEQNDSLLTMSLSIGLRAKVSNALLLRKNIQSIKDAEGLLGYLEFQDAGLSTFDCLLETVPGFRAQIRDEHTLLASNAVHFLPFFEADSGSDRPIAVFQTRGGGTFSVNPVDPSLANFNWLISGTSGAGKSFFVNSLLSQSMSLDPRIFIVEIGASYKKLTHYLGGKFIGLDATQGFRMSPFFLEPSSNAAEEERRREHIQMIFWEMLRENGVLPTIQERALLKKTLFPYFSMPSLPEHPITAICSDLKAGEPNPLSERLYLLLERWCYPSMFGRLLDHPRPFKFEEKFLTFDLSGLQEFEDLSRIVQLIICSTLWGQIRQDSHLLTLIVLDEVAFSLLKSQPLFVDELVSTVRKHNSGAILITQDIEKITSSRAGSSILQNTQMKAIFQQRGDRRNLVEPLGLNSEELSAIESLQRAKGRHSDLFLMVDNKRSLIRHVPNQLEYLLGTSAPDDNRWIKSELEKLDGSFRDRILSLSTRVCQ